MLELLQIPEKSKKIIPVRQKDLESALKDFLSSEEINALEIIGNETIYQFDWMKCVICKGNNLGPDPSGYMSGGCRDDLGRDFGCYDCTHEVEKKRYKL